MSLALRFAWRELRSGVAGFRIFLACLALGVAAIAAAGSTAEAFRQGLAAQARDIMGGDVSFTVEQRRFTPDERAAFARLGTVGYAARANAMAEAPSKGGVPGLRRLVAVRGVDARYPLVGRVELRGAVDLRTALQSQDGAFGAVVEQALLDRLGLKVGDPFLIGTTPYRVSAVLLSEPDRLARGFALGPRVLTSLEAVERSEFLTVGGLFGETARVVLPPSADPETAVKTTLEAFPKASLEARERTEAAPGAGELIDELEYFLGFIGLASLVAGGLGVSGAVAAYLEGRKSSIAALKALGAEGTLIRNLYLIQIGVLALLGVAIGLAVGAAAPLIIGALAGDRLPVPALFGVYPVPLLGAGAFGLLAAAAFSLVPLARARTTPPAALFRREMTGRLRWGAEVAGALVAGAGLAGLAVATAPTAAAAVGLIGGTAAAFLVLWALGLGAAALAGRARRGAKGPWRLGLANLAGPRSAARTASPAIGLGVALLAAVVLIQSSLLAQVTQVAPRTAPSLVFTEIDGARVPAFDAVVRRALGGLDRDRYRREPIATGRIVRLKGAPVNIEAIEEGERWAFDNDVVISAIDAEPEDSGVTAGRWWPAGYRGPPLVAMEQDAARGAGLKVGDVITLSVLGREMDVRIAALRKIEWGGFGANFALILTPSAVEGASLRHVAIARATQAQEARITADLGRDFPEVNVISVREQLEAAADIFSRLALAVRGAAAVAALAGLLVLVGAIAAGAKARAREAATLKVLGGSRAQILTAYLVEYGLVGLVAGTAGVALGALAAWPVVTAVFDAEFSIDWSGVLLLTVSATALAALGGGLAAWQALAQRPAPVLR
jgi:putative ABC transport system permease protein